MAYDQWYWFSATPSSRNGRCEERLNFAATHSLAEREAYNEVSARVQFPKGVYETRQKRVDTAHAVWKKLQEYGHKKYKDSLTEDTGSLPPEQSCHSFPSISGIDVLTGQNPFRRDRSLTSGFLYRHSSRTHYGDMFWLGTTYV